MTETRRDAAEESRQEGRSRFSLREEQPIRLAFSAVVLGIVSVIVALLIGLVGYYASMRATEHRYQQFYFNKANMLAAIAANSKGISDGELLARIELAWRKGGYSPEDEYVCIVDKESRLVLHTAAPETVGKDVGNNALLGSPNRPTCRLKDLVQEGDDYLGNYISSTGQSQLAAFARIPDRQWTIGVHRSKEALAKEVRSGISFLAAGFMVVCGLLLPFSLLRLYRIGYVALQKSRSTEAALRKSEFRLQEAQRIAHVGNWEWDAETDALAWSDELRSILGVRADATNFKRSDLDTIYTPESTQRMIASENAAMEAGAPYELELERVREDGAHRWVVVRGEPVFDAQRRITGLRGTAIDITERKQAEEERLGFERQVQQAQKLESLGVLAGGIAHDFNNILVSILGHADLALEDVSRHTPVRENLTEIVNGARRAADLAAQMLAYAGKGRFELRAIDLSEFVREMAHLLEISTSKKAIVHYRFADYLPAIEGDATQIRQVIMNLITNASEAIGDQNGVISLSTGTMECDSEYLRNLRVHGSLPAGTYVYLEVADTGCGMVAETQEKMFDPFFTTKFTGRGLGMAAVLGIVYGHGGAIKVSSEPGKGTTIRVLFPASAQQPEKSSQASGVADPVADAWEGAGTVLLVDDERTVRFLGQRMLEKVGFKVLTAADGREALTVFQEHRDDIVCVVVDLTMPQMDGEECFRELRRLKSDVRVVMSSGYDEQDVTRRFVGEGLTGFLQKPYEFATLRMTMKQVIES